MSEIESAAIANRSAGPPPDPHRADTLEAFSDVRYRDAFWPGRRYEDSCDRIALRAMLPATGERLIEVGAGYGRLADEYAGFRNVVLTDVSETLLEAARQQLASEARYEVVTGDAYSLPFGDASFDAVVCVRVIHHLEDPRPAIAEFARVLRPGGVLVIESRNKRDLKAIIAYLLRRQAWSPFARGSRRYEGTRLVPSCLLGRGAGRSGSSTCSGQAPQAWSAPVSFLHAPADLRTWLRRAGLRVEATRSVGILRLPVLTRHLPAGLLIGLERVLQVILASVTPGPSLFLRAVRSGPADPDER